MIPVTKTYLPPVKRYISYLRKIWQTGQVTNHGKLVTNLEKKLKKYLGVKHLHYVSNGTIGLQIAIKALGIKGEIITSPFSYVASTSTIVWEGCQPVFVDINPKTLCIDVEKIEQAITKHTKAILAIHVYGNACDVEQIEKIAQKYKLKVIYDAAHAFGVMYKNSSILNYGDISTLSFHATKVFHTAEGGAIIANDDETSHKISYLRNFGHNGQEAFFGLGINGKNSEFHAAMGLCLLPEVKKIIEKRKLISNLYNDMFFNTVIKRPALHPKIIYNYAYYPIILPSEEILLKIKGNLNKNDIFPRRYFYPSLTRLNYVKRFNCPIAEDISKRILCLPLYSTLLKKEAKGIANLVLKVL